MYVAYNVDGKLHEVDPAGCDQQTSQINLHRN